MMEVARMMVMMLNLMIFMGSCIAVVFAGVSRTLQLQHVKIGSV